MRVATTNGTEGNESVCIGDTCAGVNYGRESKLGWFPASSS